MYAEGGHSHLIIFNIAGYSWLFFGSPKMLLYFCLFVCYKILTLDKMRIFTFNSIHVRDYVVFVFILIAFTQI